MGTWSGSPFGNDTAADCAWDLDDSTSWDVVAAALNDVLVDEYINGDDGSIAVAAAEVVCHGLGRPTQTDVYSERAAAFAQRAGAPPAELVVRAVHAVDAVTGPSSELAELWAEGDQTEWASATAMIRRHLLGSQVPGRLVPKS